MMLKCQFLFFIPVLFMFELVAATEEEEPILTTTNSTNEDTGSRESTENIDHESNLSENLNKEEDVSQKLKPDLQNAPVEHITQHAIVSGNLTKEGDNLLNPKSDIRQDAVRSIDQQLTSIGNPTEGQNQLLKPESHLQFNSKKNSTSDEQSPSKQTDIVTRLFKHFDVENWDQLHEKLPQLKSPPSEKFLQALEFGSTESNPNVNKSPNSASERSREAPVNEFEEPSVSNMTESKKNISFPLEAEDTNKENVNKIPENSERERSSDISQNVTEASSVPSEHLAENSQNSGLKSIDNENISFDQTKLEDKGGNSDDKSSNDETEGNQSDRISEVDNRSTTEEPDLFTAQDKEQKSRQIETITTTESLREKSVNEKSETRKDILRNQELKAKEKITRSSPLSNSENTLGLRSLHQGNKLKRLKSILQNSGTDKLVYDPSVYQNNHNSQAQIKQNYYSPKFKPLPLPFLYGGINKNEKSRVQNLPNRSVTSNNLLQMKSNLTNNPTQNYPVKTQNTRDLKPDIVPGTNVTDYQINETNRTRKDIGENKILNEDKAEGAQDSAEQREAKKYKEGDKKLEETSSNDTLTEKSYNENQSKFKDDAASKPTAIPDTVKPTNPPENELEITSKRNIEPQSHKERNKSGNDTDGAHTSFKSVTQVLMEKIANLEALINKTNTDKYLNKPLRTILPKNKTPNKNGAQEDKNSTYKPNVKDKLKKLSHEGKIAGAQRNVYTNVENNRQSQEDDSNNQRESKNPKLTLAGINKIEEKLKMKKKFNDTRTEELKLKKPLNNTTQVLIDKIAHLEELINQTNADKSLHPKINSTFHNIGDKNKQILQDKIKNQNLPEENNADESLSKPVVINDGQNEKSNSEKSVSVEEAAEEKGNTVPSISNNSSQVISNNFTEYQSDSSYQNESSVTTATPIEPPDKIKPINSPTNKPDETKEDIDTQQFYKNTTKTKNKTLPLASLKNITQVLVEKIKHLEELINHTNADGMSDHKQNTILPNNERIDDESEVSQSKDSNQNASLFSEEGIENNLNTSNLLLAGQKNKIIHTTKIPATNLKSSRASSTTVALTDLDTRVSKHPLKPVSLQVSHKLINTKSAKVPGTLDTLLSILRKFKHPDSTEVINLDRRQPMIRLRKSFINPISKKLYTSSPENPGFSTLSRYFTHQKLHLQLSNTFDDRMMIANNPISVSSYIETKSRRSPIRGRYGKYYFPQSKSGFQPYDHPFTHNFQHAPSSYNPYAFQTWNYGYYSPEGAFSKMNVYRLLNRDIFSNQGLAYNFPNHFAQSKISKNNPHMKQQRSQRFLPENRKRTFQFQGPPVSEPNYVRYFSQPIERTHHPHSLW